MIVIGDVHGHFKGYQLLRDKFPGEFTLQLGDMGVGFPNGNDADLALGPKDYFFCGNHDNRAAANQYANHLGKGGQVFFDDLGFFYVPGAWSIDKNWRLSPQWIKKYGITWWEDEELTVSELNDLIEWYSRVKPEIMITHDAPSSIAEKVLNAYTLDGHQRPKPVIPTRTGQALQAMLDIHRPQIWIFGHYHTNWRYDEDGTSFQCLPELGFVEVK